MEETNKKTLIEALSALREYDPPSDIWDRIDLEVELGKEGLVQSDKLHDLPEHDPPEKVWENIKSTLMSDSRRGGKLVQMRWVRPLSMAATLAVLVAAFFIIQNQIGQPRNEGPFTISYSEEEVDGALLKNDWAEDEDDFQQYKLLCDAKQYICEQPEFQVLQQEFDELSSAIQDLEYAIGDYGANADFITQIKEIELERTGVFKRMMVMLI